MFHIVQMNRKTFEEKILASYSVLQDAVDAYYAGSDIPEKYLDNPDHYYTLKNNEGAQLVLE